MYCSQSDLEQRIDPQVLRSLADDDADGLADAAVLNAAIADADALIDTHLRARYSTPLVPVPDVVRAISAWFAIYFLMARRNETVPAEYHRRYEAELALLDRLAGGEIALGAAQASRSPLLAQSTREAEERVFDEESLDNF